MGIADKVKTGVGLSTLAAILSSGCGLGPDSIRVVQDGKKRAKFTVTDSDGIRTEKILVSVDGKERTYFGGDYVLNEVKGQIGGLSRGRHVIQIVYYQGPKIKGEEYDIRKAEVDIK